MSDTARPRWAIEEARRRVRAAVGEFATGLAITPAFPLAWPDAGGKVVFWVYPVETLPTGTIWYQVHSPSQRITLHGPDAKPERADLPGTTVLGREGPPKGPPDAELSRAEQAVLDVVAGSRLPADAVRDMRPYLVWLKAHPMMAHDLESRAGSFVAWLTAASQP